MFFTRRRTIIRQAETTPNTYEYMIQVHSSAELPYLTRDACRWGEFSIQLDIPSIGLYNYNLITCNDGRYWDKSDSNVYNTFNAFLQFESEIPDDCQCNVSVILHMDDDRSVAFYDMSTIGSDSDVTEIYTPSYPSYPKDTVWKNVYSFTTSFSNLISSGININGSKRYKPQYIGMHFEYIAGTYLMVPNKTYIHDGNISSDFLDSNVIPIVINFPYFGTSGIKQGEITVNVNLDDISNGNPIVISQFNNYAEISDAINYWGVKYKLQTPRYNKNHQPEYISDVNSNDESLFIYFNGLGEGLGDSVGGGGYGYN